MHRTPRGSLVACVTAACSLLLITAPLTVPAQAATGPVVDPAIARSPELSETSRLSDRRFVVTGDRAWALGAADGSYPAAGFHTRGEMGGFWLPNLKLLDGMWFNINGDWIKGATKTTSGWGYVRADLPTTNGVSASRTDFVPRGVSGALVGLTLRSDSNRTITLRADAHSELISSYPWGETKPSQTLVNLAGLGVGSGQAFAVPRQGHTEFTKLLLTRLGCSVRKRPFAVRDQDRQELPRPAGPGSDLPSLWAERTAAAETL